jgi:hypothetical protein
MNNKVDEDCEIWTGSMNNGVPSIFVDTKRLTVRKYLCVSLGIVQGIDKGHTWAHL